MTSATLTLVERLRQAEADYTIEWGSGDLYEMAADEIERLTRDGWVSVEIGELVDLGEGTIFVQWNEERFRLPVGTKIYARKSEPPAHKGELP